MTFEEWWEEYHKISIYGKGYKALAKDAWDKAYWQGFKDAEEEVEDHVESTGYDI